MGDKQYSMFVPLCIVCTSLFFISCTIIYLPLYKQTSVKIMLESCKNEKNRNSKVSWSICHWSLLLFQLKKKKKTKLKLSIVFV